MSYNPQNPNGQATSANSAPVVIASDQSTLPVSLSGGATSANQTNGTQQTKITDGTNVANVVAPGTATSTGNALLAAPTSQSQTFSVTSVTTGTAYDVGNYRWVSVQVASQYVGTTPTITFQASNDNATWVNTQLLQTTVSTAAPSQLTTSTGIFHGPLPGRYFRLNFTGAYSSGTATGTIVFSSMPSSSPVVGANVNNQVQSTTGTITTSSSSVVTASITGAGGFAQISTHGTYAGVSFGITESDDAGTTFYGVPVYDSAANSWLAPGATISPGTNAGKVYWVPLMPNTAQIRVLASAYTSGTANIRIAATATAAPGSSMAQIMDSAGNNRGANVTAANALQVDGSAVTQPVSGNVGASTATGLAVPANAFYHGANPQTALPTPATAGNLTGITSDKFGRLVVLNNAMRDIVGMQDTTITASISATTVVSAIASTKTDITSIQMSNISGTATLATLSDGTNSYHFYVPAGDMRGAAYNVPLPATTANTAWTVTCGTSITSLYVTVVYIKNQ